MEELGLFPLPIVLLPGERAPLHLFEERYRELIAECEATGGGFGLVLADDDGMRTVGTRATVAAILERFDDGRSNVAIAGGERFSIDALTQGRSFATARVRPYSDDPGADTPSPDELARCLEVFADLSAAAGGEARAPELDATDAGIAFDIAGRIGFAADAKQELLEMRSERARVRLVTELMDAAASELRRRATIRDLAAGNGHVAGG
jgi:Lon protease-like protein